MNSDVPGAGVTMTRPDGTGGGNNTPRVNVSSSRSVKNSAPAQPGPAHAATTQRWCKTRPQVALDLHYVLSFFGNEAQLDPQRLMGSVVRTLNSFPVLTRRMINDTVASTALGFLAATNLADQDELVKLTPTDLSLEDLSKLWSVFFQTPFVLSVTYRASVVLIEGDETPLAALPVQERRIVVLPFEQPRNEEVVAQGAADPRAFILANSVLRSAGSGWRGEVTSAHRWPACAAGQRQRPRRSPQPATCRAVRRCGPGYRASRWSTMSCSTRRRTRIVASSPTSRPSCCIPRLRRRRLRAASSRSTLRRRCGLVSAQACCSTRSAWSTRRLPSRFPWPGPVADEPAPQFKLGPGWAAGQYFVRLQVEGADSPLDLDPASVTFGRRLTFP